MKLKVFETAKEAGEYSARETSDFLNEVIRKNGSARIVLSTGASQFEFFDAIVKCDVDWSKVEMFHLDEYIGLEDGHKAGFAKYLTERFTSKIALKKAHFVNGKGDIEENIRILSEEINRAPVDIGLIGIGENAHIAFNDPPADFDDTRAYKVVKLDERCKQQQINEGWFLPEETVDLSAITMTCSQIMRCNKIISLVPYKVKAQAIKDSLENSKTPNIPATLLQKHADCTIVCDKDSASLLSESTMTKLMM